MLFPIKFGIEHPKYLGGVLILKVILAALLICNDVRQLLVQPDTRFIVCGLRSFEIFYCLRAILNLLRSHESCPCLAAYIKRILALLICGSGIQSQNIMTCSHLEFLSNSLIKFSLQYSI